MLFYDTSKHPYNVISRKVQKLGCLWLQIYNNHTMGLSKSKIPR